ncbi:hypothetical protein HY407_02810 [Candidatus Gottesmanbacteria bacterium]|nr:hypothetical protein [Candidatus Gottesmanbacteria bacterium]
MAKRNSGRGKHGHGASERHAKKHGGGGSKAGRKRFKMKSRRAQRRQSKTRPV